jgi:hypothetical protein
MPAHAIRSRLSTAGFKRSPTSSGNEEVYDLWHTRDNHYVVRVYSSIRAGMDEARGCGGDAIRIVALHIDNNVVTPIFKATRIHRTGTVEGVLDRMIERSREAYGACNEHRAKRTNAATSQKPTRKVHKQGTELVPGSLAEWRKKLNDFLVQELGIADALHQNDPYKICPAMGPAFQHGQTPEAFAKQHFAEEFAR